MYNAEKKQEIAGRSSFPLWNCQTSQDISSNYTLHVYLPLKINIKPAFALPAALQLTYHRDVQNVSFEVLFTNPHKWNLSQARHPKASMEDVEGHLGYTWHFPFSLSGPWNSSKRKHTCNHKLKVKVCQWGPMLRLYLGSMRIKHVKYFCGRCLSLPDKHIEKRMVCLLFLVLLNNYVGVTRLSHHLMSLPKNPHIQSPLNFTF